MLKSRKHVFWEALLVTIVIFLIGLFIGMMVETGNSIKIANLHANSEISLVDSLATTIFTNYDDFSCKTLREKIIDFANRVYQEARMLEKYEDSNTITEGMKILHRKYDLLRTLLWWKSKEVLEKCKNFDLVVYLYDYETEDIEKKALQNVWSKILSDVKSQKEDMVLVPIAADQNITSLDLLTDRFNISRLPAVIINNKEVIYDFKTVEDFKKLF